MIEVQEMKEMTAMRIGNKREESLLLRLDRSVKLDGFKGSAIATY